jgi:outer membrane translocation and assembly module TamA
VRKNAYYGGAAGLRMNTPAGPARLGLGVNRRGVDSSLNYRFYLSIGHSLLQDFPR